LFTQEELEELKSVDDEIERSFRISTKERLDGNTRDRKAKLLTSFGAAEAKRAYYEANREKIAESQRAYREANREKIADYKRAYREANREKIADYKRAYYEANRKKIAESQRAYREANREKIAESQRAYREANRERLAETGYRLKTWRKAHGLSQAEVGAACSRSQRAVSCWERGESPIDFPRLFAAYPLLAEVLI